MTGEKIYLEEPAMDTSPLAFEYCSLVRRSVIVAVYEGSRSAENTELMLDHVGNLVQNIPVFELENRPEPAAARLSYETMRRAAEEVGL